ncbi:MAG: hypothetical protein QG592_331 [Pseudomonadota bacterium]|jgi:hypothetical protein|nr:hypothetical protein [Pseudomonadota bacterium]MDQ5959252.1 hypothetical protein [Pseudomonadota bacterium]
MQAVDMRCAALLREIYSVPKIGVEIGVYKGWLSARLLAANGSLFLHMVDPWTADVSGSYLTTDDKLARSSQDQHDDAMRQALEGVKPFSGRYKVHRMTSEQAAELFESESVDFVFIDGDHSYDGCALDIRCWWPKVKPGGILSGHDYRDERNYGVQKAVHEFLGERELRLGLNHTWFITK